MRTYPALELSWPARPDDEHLERLLAAIDEASPTAVEDQPSGIRVFFGSSDARDRAAVSVRVQDPTARCTPVECPDDGWAERSQAGLEPVRVGRLLITSNETAASTGLISIVIKPSMGFGTGHHASTRLCLRLLQDAPLEGQRVLDVGTGSGVLAIAAARLGAAGVTAIDVDPDALMAARENVALNGVERTVTLLQEDLSSATCPRVGRFGLVLANLTGALLTREAEQLTTLAHPAGLLIASGLLADEEADVTRAFAGLGCSVVTRTQEEEWVGLMLRT